MRGRLARSPFVLLVGGLALGAFSMTFSHLAGSLGGPGFDDGASNDAHFNSPTGIAVDGSGNVYVADSANHTIRKLSTSGAATTLAGLAETAQFADGKGAHARFNTPRGLVVDSSGNIFVADYLNSVIRKITPAGAVTTFAGSPGLPGFVNDTGTLARFRNPRGITIDGSGNLYVADTLNHAIRMVTPAGVVTTVAGTGLLGNVNATGTAASFNTPIGIVFDSNSLFVADWFNRVIRQITLPGAVVTTFAGTMNTSGHADGIPGLMRMPSGICVDPASHTLYVSDEIDNTIRSITSGGTLGSVAGSQFGGGSDDGAGTGARFFGPTSIACNGSELYVADTRNHTVRKITLPGNVVTTFSGMANATGLVNGMGDAARFNRPNGLAFFPGEFAYVADTSNSVIRKVGMDGTVQTHSGSGIFGYVEDSTAGGHAARFASPNGLAPRFSDQAVYVADTNNHCIRIVSANGGTAAYAGVCTVSGYKDDTRLSARFNAPYAVAVNSHDDVYVADTGNFVVRKIDGSTGDVTTLAGSGTAGFANGNGTSASFRFITGIMVDSNDNVYVAESDSYRIRKITPAGDVTTLAGSPNNVLAPPADGIGTAALFGYPGPTSISGDPVVSDAFIADPSASLIRSIALNTAEVGTVGGRALFTGTADGTGTSARFNGASVIAASRDSMVIAEGNTIRFGGPDIDDRAVVDSAFGLTGNLRQLDTSPQTATAWNWSIIRRPSGSTANLSSSTVRNPTFVPDVADLYVFRCVATSVTGSSISTVTIQGNGPATTFTIFNPNPVTAGVSSSMRVRALDADGNVGDGYLGTVHFTSNDPNATLPSNYTFINGDHGEHFLDFTLEQAGSGTTITATDTATGSITGTSVIVVSAAAAASLDLSMPTPIIAGNPTDITVTAKDAFGNTDTQYGGTVHFTSSDNSATLPPDYTFTPGVNGSSRTLGKSGGLRASATGDAGTHTFVLGVTFHTGGTQNVNATDTADPSIGGGTSMAGVTPPVPGSFSAIATSSLVSITWAASAGADHYDVWRATPTSGAYAFRASSDVAAFADSDVSADKVYVYKVLARSDAAAVPSVFSTPDAATTIVFEQDPLGATIIRGTHIVQLRTAVNSILACAGADPIDFSDSTLTGGVLVKKAHIEQLRAGLNDARSTLGLPPIDFTDQTLTTSTLIQTLHISDIRNGVK